MRCPTPTKRCHADEEAARAHLRSLEKRWGKTAQVHVYKCKCGAWHVGGRRKRFGRHP